MLPEEAPQTWISLSPFIWGSPVLSSMRWGGLSTTHIVKIAYQKLRLQYVKWKIGCRRPNTDLKVHLLVLIPWGLGLWLTYWNFLIRSFLLPNPSSSSRISNHLYPFLTQTVIPLSYSWKRLCIGDFTSPHPRPKMTESLFLSHRFLL